MATTYKVNYMFQFDRYGWSENHYLQANSFNDATTQVKDVRDARIQCLGGGGALVAFRVSQVGVPRSGRLFRPSSGVTKGTQYTATPDNVDSMDVPWTVILCRHYLGTDQDAAVKAVDTYMGGIPDGVISASDFPVLTLNEKFLPLLNTYFTALADNNFGGYVYGSELVNDWQTPTTVAKDAVTGRVQVNIGNVQVAQGQTIRFDTFDRTDYPFLKGTHKIMTPNANGFLLYTEWTNVEELPVNTPIRYRKLEKIFRPISFSDYAIVTHRDRGRPFDSPRGRRSRAS